MKIITRLGLCGMLAATVAIATPPAEAASKAKCQIYAKKQADRIMGPKAVENAMLVGATAGLAGQKGKKKKKFYGFGLSGAAIGFIVVGSERQKHYNRYLKRCMGQA
jgi:hypothetical protein